jgi:hypothetical protein
MRHFLRRLKYELACVPFQRNMRRSRRKLVVTFILFDASGLLIALALYPLLLCWIWMSRIMYVDSSHLSKNNSSTRIRGYITMIYTQIMNI